MTCTAPTRFRLRLVTAADNGPGTAAAQSPAVADLIVLCAQRVLDNTASGHIYAAQTLAWARQVVADATVANG